MKTFAVKIVRDPQGQLSVGGLVDLVQLNSDNRHSILRKELNSLGWEMGAVIQQDADSAMVVAITPSLTGITEPHLLWLAGSC